MNVRFCISCFLFLTCLSYCRTYQYTVLSTENANKISAVESKCKLAGRYWQPYALYGIIPIFPLFKPAKDLFTDKDKFYIVKQETTIPDGIVSVLFAFWTTLTVQSVKVFVCDSEYFVRTNFEFEKEKAAAFEKAKAEEHLRQELELEKLINENYGSMEKAQKEASKKKLYILVLRSGKILEGTSISHKENSISVIINGHQEEFGFPEIFRIIFPKKIADVQKKL